MGSRHQDVQRSNDPSRSQHTWQQGSHHPPKPTLSSHGKPRKNPTGTGPRRIWTSNPSGVTTPITRDLRRLSCALALHSTTHPTAINTTLNSIVNVLYVREQSSP